MAMRAWQIVALVRKANSMICYVTEGLPFRALRIIGLWIPTGFGLVRIIISGENPWEEDD